MLICLDIIKEAQINFYIFLCFNFFVQCVLFVTDTDLKTYFLCTKLPIQNKNKLIFIKMKRFHCFKKNYYFLNNLQNHAYN